MSKTVSEIVKDWLTKHNLDGLYHDDCGCSKDDLFPCDSPFMNCVAGYAHQNDCDCPNCEGIDCEYDFVITDKPVMPKTPEQPDTRTDEEIVRERITREEYPCDIDNNGNITRRLIKPSQPDDWADGQDIDTSGMTAKPKPDSHLCNIVEYSTDKDGRCAACGSDSQTEEGGE